MEAAIISNGQRLHRPDDSESSQPVPIDKRLDSLLQRLLSFALSEMATVFAL